MIHWLHIGCLAMALAAGGLLAQSTTAPVFDRYAVIPDRNVFGLRPPPPPPPPPKTEPPPPPLKVQLTGVIHVKSLKAAVLLVSELSKDPTTKILSENQADGPVAVKSIDVEAGKVRVVLNNTIETELDFEKDGVKSAPSSGKGGLVFEAAADAGPRPSATQILAGAAKGDPPPRATSTAGLISYLQQASKASLNSSSATPPALPRPGGYAATPNPLGGHTFRFDGPANLGQPQPNWPPEQPVSYEESIIHMEILRTLKESGKMDLPPLPPTILTPGHGEEIPTPPSPGGLPPLPPIPGR